MSSSSAERRPSAGSSLASGSLLARTSTLLPSPAALSHVRTYLEALVPPSRRMPTMPRSASTLNISYRPQKPSSLASSASAAGSDRNADTPPTDSSEEEEDTTSARADETSKPKDGSESSFSSTTSPKSAASPPPTFALSDTTGDSIAGVMEVLGNETIDEEEKIDQVRQKLGDLLEDVEGAKTVSIDTDKALRSIEDRTDDRNLRPSLQSAFRLDSIVLEVMHRHREDQNPTGATFPSSPLRRPTAVARKSTAGSSLHRPWTPGKINVSSPSTAFTGTSDSIVDPPRTPTRVTDSSSALGSSSLGGTPASRSVSPGPTRDPGVIGSGSPRVSPRLWNTPLTPLSGTREAGNPWGGFNLPSGPTTPSGLSSSFSFAGPSSPLSSVPPGLSAFAPGTAGSSRPTSPSPFNSPRMNVAAAAFKPRTDSTSSQASAIRPGLLESSRRASSQSVLLKNHPTGADDDEDDEFSPFASSMASGRTDAATGTASSYQGSSASSSGGYEGSGMAIEEDEVGGMTPFDVLYSIFSNAGDEAPQWTPEQIEEALASHNWDVDATLASIFESGDQLPTSSSRTLGIPGTPPYARSPRLMPAVAGVRAGVNVMARDSFSSYRGGRTASYGSRAGTPPIRGGVPMSPGPSGQGGGVGPGRVCRYFLAGDCRRADCRFSHDLNKALCKFWLRGQCLNDPCPFLHDPDIVQALAGQLAAGTLTGSGPDSPSPLSPAAFGSEEQQSTPAASDDFPELPPSGPKAQRIRGPQPPPGAPTGPAAADPSRTRWAAALQRNKAPTPLAIVQQGGSDVGLINIHSRGGPTRGIRPPLGPRSASSSSIGSAAGRPTSARIALRAPVLLPTLAIGKSAAISYSTHRGSLVPLIEQRNRSLAKASEAFRAGDGAAARKWSAEGQGLNVQLKEQNATAAREMLAERHRELAERLRTPAGADGGGWGSAGNASEEVGTRGMRGKTVGGGLGVCLGVARKDAIPTMAGRDLSIDERTEVFLDCHGLHANEAVEFAEEFLLSLERESMHHGLVYLSIGSSKHSALSTDKRRVKIAGAVKSFLASWGYPFAELDGILVVDPGTHY